MEHTSSAQYNSVTQLSKRKRLKQLQVIKTLRNWLNQLEKKGFRMIGKNQIEKRGFRMIGQNQIEIKGWMMIGQNKLIQLWVNDNVKHLKHQQHVEFDFTKKTSCKSMRSKHKYNQVWNILFVVYFVNGQMSSSQCKYNSCYSYIIIIMWL